MKRRAIIAVLVVYTMFLVFSLADYTLNFGFPVHHYYIVHHVEETASENIVNSIYMFYRYFDTMFESMILLFGLIAVIYLSIRESGDTYE